MEFDKTKKNHEYVIKAECIKVCKFLLMNW